MNFNDTVEANTSIVSRLFGDQRFLSTQKMCSLPVTKKPEI